MHEVEVSARIGALIVHHAAADGWDPGELLAATGFAPEMAADADARIPLALETKLWDEAARRSGDDAFGLHVAETLRPGVFDVLDYAIRTAPTVRAALERLARYNRLEHDAAVFTIIDRGPVTRVEHTLRVAGATQSRHAAEFTLASLVVVGRQISGAKITARTVAFRHAAPASRSEHLRVFGVEPSFSQPVNAIELDREALALSVPATDPMLSRVIERHAEALLAARPEPRETASDRVRRILAASLGKGEGSLAAVAEKLKMSERSLQRRLADEGLTFDGLLDDIRRELALRYLADRDITIGEVAYLLGYSEPSAFHRAFKRWTGATPRCAAPRREPPSRSPRSTPEARPYASAAPNRRARDSQ